MKTLESREEIVIGMQIRFAELWDGEGDGEELLKSGSICVGEDESDMPVMVGFDVIENSEYVLNATVKVNDIY